MTGFTVLPYGEQAVLIELTEAADVLPLRDALLAREHPALRTVVPAARTVLVAFDPVAISPAQLDILIRQCQAVIRKFQAAPAMTPGGTVRILLDYDGPDLASVAEQTGLPVAEVIRRHLAPDYAVQFCGFSPGFGYLTGLDPTLWLPRLASPRGAVPAGSVAIAGEYSAVYPSSSPGGWRLLGRTEAVLFDLNRSPPALLRPGTTVRFVRR